MSVFRDPQNLRETIRLIMKLAMREIACDAKA